MPDNSRVDLHIHTTASSDGQHSPAEIFEMAAKIGLKAIAFGDHNSVDSIEEGFKLSEKTGIELIPCFELNTMYEDMDIHILAYFIEHRDKELGRWLGEIHEAKYVQADKRLAALKNMDFSIEKKDIDRFAKGKPPSGATFLSALLCTDKGKNDIRLQPYINGNRSDSPSLNFYLDYFRQGKPAYAPLDVCPLEKGIKKIKELGGIPVQAHPSDTGTNNINRFIELGLMGIEAYSSYHNEEECEDFRLLAEKTNIIYTAGSDFHGKKIKPNVSLGDIKGNSYEIVERLKDAKKNL